MRFLVVISVFLLMVGLVRAGELEEQGKLRVIRKELEESREKLKQTKKEQQEILWKLVVITKDLKKANQSLNRAKEKINENEVKINQLTVELRQTEDELQRKSGVLSKRLSEVYKSSGVNYLDLLFSCCSMSDFLNRLYFFEKVIAQDAGIIQDIKSDLQTVKVKRAVLTERSQEIKKLAEVIAEQKKKIAERAEEEKKAYEKLKERQAEYESKIAELERSSHELIALIQKKMAERAKVGIAARGSGVLIWPLRGRITSRFGVIRRWGGGYRHTGVDIAAPYGAPIVAADSGEVIFSGWWDGYGKAVVIDHGRGWSTVYAHLSRIYVQVGTRVAKEQTIGLEGSTGYSTGPHLHFEVRKNGVPVNPMPFLP